MNRNLLVCAVLAGILFVHLGYSATNNTISSISKNEPYSIFFIVDVSSSNNETDPDGIRFEVLQDLYDSIYARCPEALVGMVYLSSELYFNPADDSLFTKVSGGTYKGGYIPLLELTNEYSGTFTNTDGSGGIVSTSPYSANGLAILKMYTQVKLGGFNYMIPEYEPSYVIIQQLWTPDPPGAGLLTNINASFDAAKDALSKSPHAKDKHYIIFFSDGMANLPQNTDMEKYVKGENVPTTFTIFYNPTSSDLAKLQTMTSNIKDNGYSSANSELTDIWDMDMDYKALMELLIEKVLGDSKVPELIALESPTLNKRPVFKWHKPEADVSSYTIQIDTNFSFASPLISVPVNDTFFTPLIDLPLDTIYWRVNGENSPWSAIGSLIITDQTSIGSTDKLKLHTFGIGNTKVEIFTLTGRLVARLEPVSMGRNQINWDYKDQHGIPVSSGVYLLKVTTGKERFFQRILVSRYPAMSNYSGN